MKEMHKILSTINLSSKESKNQFMDLKEFLLDRKFYSLIIEEPKSVIHLEVLSRHQNLLSKSLVKSLQDYILLL